MAQHTWWTDEVDLSQPSSARVYDVHLGGSHNFQVDREMAEQAARLMPELPAVLRANRSFLRRAVQYLTGRGITQFLDLGSGIPTVGNVHQVAQEHDRRSRVVYVDRDVVATIHSEEILHGNDTATAIRADLRDPDDVLSRPEVTAMLDLNRPVAVLLVSVLHFVPDEDEPDRIVGQFMDRMAPGSCVAIAHACNDGADPSTQQAADLYQQRMGGFWLRSGQQIRALFGGLPFVDPGLVELHRWRPDPGDAAPSAQLLPGLAGVAVKP